MSHPHLFLHTLIRWLDFIALVTLLGGAVYGQFVWRPLSVRFPRPEDRLARQMMIGALLVLAVTSMMDLILRSLMISGLPLSELPSVMPAVLRKTHFGAVWTGRFLLLLLLLGFLSLRGGQGHAGRLGFPLIASAGLALTTTLSGHAANRGNLTLTVLMDWIHVMAVSSWVGGLFALRLHLYRQIALLKGEIRRECLTAGMSRFSTVAVVSVGALITTGLYNTYVHVHSPTLLIGTPYGRILIVKWSLVLPMLLLGAVNRYAILPTLQADVGKVKGGFLSRIVMGAARPILSNPNPLHLERWFFRFVMIEVILGLGVLACSAWMTQLPPPHRLPAAVEHGHGS